MAWQKQPEPTHQNLETQRFTCVRVAEAGAAAAVSRVEVQAVT